jgi:hypothetical protein
MTDPARDPRIVLSALARTHPVVELGSLDVCFLAALHLRAAGAALAAFDEQKLCEVFDEVCVLLEPRSSWHASTAQACYALANLPSLAWQLASSSRFWKMNH